MNKRVGVDIGTTGVRVAAVRGVDARGLAVVSRLGWAPLLPNAIVHGKIRDIHMVSEALNSALRDAGVSTYGFVTGVASSDCAVTQAALPAALNRGERNLVLSNSDEPIAGGLSSMEAVLSTNRIRVDSTGDGSHVATVAVGVASSEEMTALRSVMRLARCQPRAVDLDGAALMRALVRTTPDTAEIHTIVDIGARTTTVVTRKGLHLRSLRVLQAGGDNITDAIVGATGESWDDASQRKTWMRLASAPVQAAVTLESGYGDEDTPIYNNEAEPQLTALDEAVANAGDELVDAIAGAVEHDAGSWSNEFTQGIVLCGRGAQLRGLRERLHQRIGVPVRLGRPWARLEHNKYNRKHFEADNGEQTALVGHAVAIGLALWKEQP